MYYQTLKYISTILVIISFNRVYGYKLNPFDRQSQKAIRKTHLNPDSVIKVNEDGRIKDKLLYAKALVIISEEQKAKPLFYQLLREAKAEKQDYLEVFLENELGEILISQGKLDSAFLFFDAVHKQLLHDEFRDLPASFRVNVFNKLGFCTAGWGKAMSPNDICTRPCLSMIRLISEMVLPEMCI